MKLYFYSQLNERLIDKNEFINSKNNRFIPDDIKQSIINIDPNKDENNVSEYSQWLAKVYRSNDGLRPRFKEDLYKVKEAFNIIKDKKLKIDLFKFNDFNSLLDETDKYKDKQSNKEIKKEQRKELLRDVVRILDTDKWRIEVPRTEEASCEIGKGTRWCTAATESDNAFEDYNNDGNLYVITNKLTNIKHQLWYGEGEDMQLMNEKDDPVVNKTIIPPIVWEATSRFERKDRNKIIYVNEFGELHNEDGPAVVSHGSKYWFINGLAHRKDGPAIEGIDGTKYWFINGLAHREDGPAVIYASGTKYWFKNGVKHREDGPAVELPNGTKHWYKNGKQHREDGPAIELANGNKEWWLNDKKLTKREFNNLIKKSNFKSKKVLKESRKLGDKFETEKIKKHIDPLNRQPHEETGRNIDVMSKIKRKGEFEVGDKKRKIPEKKQKTFYIKRYKYNKPYPKSVNGVLEYAAYKIVKYYSTINNEIKIPDALHLSFEEGENQFTLASSVNFKNYKASNHGKRQMIYRKIANKNAFFFSLIGYADTHSDNIVVDNNDNYYLIDFDFSFHPFGDKLLSIWTPQLKVPPVRKAIINSLKLYKQINIQKIRTIISETFKKAQKLLENEVDKISKEEYESVKKHLVVLQETMVTNLYYNKKEIDKFIRDNALDEDIETYKDVDDYFDEKSVDKKNLPNPSYY